MTVTNTGAAPMTIESLGLAGASIAGAKKQKKKPPQGTRVSYEDSQAATTTFTVLRLQRGYRIGGKDSCKAPPRHGKTLTTAFTIV